MNSRTTERFRRAFDALPRDVQLRARRAYRRFREDPFHPSLRFKQVHASRPIFSARVGPAYRALCVKQDDTLIWFWLGTHDEYEELLARR